MERWHTLIVRVGVALLLVWTILLFTGIVILVSGG